MCARARASSRQQRSQCAWLDCHARHNSHQMIYESLHCAGAICNHYAAPPQLLAWVLLIKQACVMTLPDGLRQGLTGWFCPPILLPPCLQAMMFAALNGLGERIVCLQRRRQCIQPSQL